MTRTSGRVMVLLVCAFASCGESKPGREGDLAGSARLSLTNAPADAPCVQIVVVGARTVVDTFALTPGESTTFVLRGLPLGADRFSAAAYPTSCDAVAPSSVASWVGDPIVATLAAGIVVDVTLVMHRNGRANVSIDFQDELDAGTGSSNGGQSGQSMDAGSGMAACSPESVTATAAQAATAVRSVLENQGTLCLPGQTVPVSTGSLSICVTAACAGTPNTCVATLGPPAFVFDSAGLSFTATADVTVNGAASGVIAGLSQSCGDLMVNAPATSFSGNLIPTIQTNPNVPSSSNIAYAVNNVVVHTGSLSISGCGVLGGAVNLAAGLLQGLIEQAAANVIQGRVFVFPCPSSGAANGTGGAGGSGATIGGAGGSGNTGDPA